MSADKTESEALAERLTKERGGVYGDPSLNLGCAAELKKVFRRYARENRFRMNPDLYSAHDDAVEQILTKIARIATGAFHEDNYADIHGYCKIAKDLCPRTFSIGGFDPSNDSNS